MKKQWEPMTLKQVGHIAEIVQCGGGKISIKKHRPRDPRKKH